MAWRVAPIHRHFTQEPRNVKALMNEEWRRIILRQLNLSSAHVAGSASEHCRSPLPHNLYTVRHLSSDPDEYTGPGGLTAREIFERVQVTTPKPEAPLSPRLCAR